MRDSVAEQWRQKLYPHIGAEVFHDLLADLTEHGWDDTRVEVQAATEIVAALSSQLDAAETEREELRLRAVMAEHHKSLSLLGRSSEAEAREDRLREQLAHAELRAEAAEAQLDAAVAFLDETAESFGRTPDDGGSN